MTQIETLELLVNSQLEQIRSQQETNQMLALSNQKLTDQAEQLQKKLDELPTRIAWLNRQLFGKRSEKLAAPDPNQLSLFHPTLPAEEQATLDAEHDEAITAIRQYESDTKTQPQTAGRPSGSRGCCGAGGHRPYPIQAYRRRTYPYTGV